MNPKLIFVFALIAVAYATEEGIKLEEVSGNFEQIVEGPGIKDGVQAIKSVGGIIDENKELKRDERAIYASISPNYVSRGLYYTGLPLTRSYLPTYTHQIPAMRSYYTQSYGYPYASAYASPYASRFLYV